LTTYADVYGCLLCYALWGELLYMARIIEQLVSGFEQLHWLLGVGLYTVLHVCQIHALSDVRAVLLEAPVVIAGTGWPHQLAYMTHSLTPTPEQSGPQVGQKQGTKQQTS
jgi:hypothetical protein